MKNNRDDDFLADVLGNAASPEFREGLLQNTLRQVRRRQQIRRLHRGLATTALVLVAIALVARFVGSPVRKSMPNSPSTDTLVVHSVPLAAGNLIPTDPRSVEVLSSRAAVARVQTAPSQDLFKPIGDDELLASLQGTPAVLVRRGPFEAELVFANPEDMKGFPVH